MYDNWNRRKTATLTDGYDRTKKPRRAKFRPMSTYQAKRLTYGDHAWILANDGTARRVKINGQPKTWKTRPDVHVPLKYGMYEFATDCSVAPAHKRMGLLSVRISEWK